MQTTTPRAQSPRLRSQRRRGMVILSVSSFSLCVVLILLAFLPGADDMYLPRTHQWLFSLHFTTLATCFLMAMFLGYNSPHTKIEGPYNRDEAFQCVDKNLTFWLGHLSLRDKPLPANRIPNRKYSNMFRLAQYIAHPSWAPGVLCSRKQNLLRALMNCLVALGMYWLCYMVIIHTIDAPFFIVRWLCAFFCTGLLFPILAILVGLDLGWNLRLGQQARQIRKNALEAKTVDVESKQEDDELVWWVKKLILEKPEGCDEKANMDAAKWAKETIEDIEY